MARLPTLLSKLLAWCGVRHRDRDLSAEIELHLDALTDAHVSRGLSADDARAAARREFGGVEQVKEAYRDQRGGWSMQDYKLGVRMLVKYPGLTLAGGLALAVAIGIGAGWYDLSKQLFRPAIPLPDGDRLIQIKASNRLTNHAELRLLHDFVEWRRDLRSVEELSAYRQIERTLTIANVPTASVTIAETTASAFRAARVPPLLGRTLVDADERPGAPGVVVLGYKVWQRWFGGRVDAIGQNVRLGRADAMVVGVMPEGFAFPVFHQAWVPLPLRASGYAPLEGGEIGVFGRLAPGVSRGEATAQLATLSAHAATASPETHGHLRLDLDPYGTQGSWTTLSAYAVTHLPITLGLLVACTMVGTLVYARTATREGEIALRYALGASRSRIVMQLFVEAVVLAFVSAAVGLVVMNYVLKWAIPQIFFQESAALPFWIHAGLAPATILYAIGLSVVAAAMFGILPALKATGSDVRQKLQNLGSGGSTLRFGAGWTTAMVMQVALTAFCIPLGMRGVTETVRDWIIRGRFPTSEYLAVPISLDRASGPAGESEDAFAQRMERTYAELEHRVAREPGVVAVTFADRLPGMAPPRNRRVQLDSVTADLTEAGSLWTSAVGPRFFEAFGRQIVAGRDFHSGDRSPGARTVIVNEAFARLWTGTSPIGRRLRYASNGGPDTPQPWYEIVGVVRDIGMTPTHLGEAPYVFHAASARTTAPLVMGVRMTAHTAMFAPRVQAIAADVDPGLHLNQVQPLDEAAWEQVDRANWLAGSNVVAVIGLALFMSAAGIFSLMSVTVARRTREIGLRSALGASSASLLRDIFMRAAKLVGAGVAIGNSLLLLYMNAALYNSWDNVAGPLVVTSVVMMTVGVMACVGPARRALRIHPTDALRDV